MKQLPTWWYKTEHFWLGYPHREMTWRLKTYYLVQAAYWCQQTIILALKIEKPRKDFKELVAHVSRLLDSSPLPPLRRVETRFLCGAGMPRQGGAAAGGV